MRQDLEDSDPTEPRIAVQKRPSDAASNVLQSRRNNALTVSLDERGVVTLLVDGHPPLLLEAEAAFDVLDFLFAFRDLLAARSIEMVERQSKMYKERD